MIRFFILVFIGMALYACTQNEPGQAILFSSLGLFVLYGGKHLDKNHRTFLAHPRSATRPEPTEQLLAKQEAEFSNSHSDFRYWPEKFNSELEI
jgi:hypothetical protein